MFRSLKRTLFVIPVMIMAFVLFGGAGVLASDAELKDSNSIIVGVQSKENTYYFSNSNTWQFESKTDVIDGDTVLKYRVINPNGKATAWSDEVAYVKQSGKFTIDFSGLAFTYNYTDFSKLTSVAKDATYYVQIKYLSIFRPFGIRLFTTDQNKDEFVKIVFNNENTVSKIPSTKINYNTVGAKIDVLANFLEGSSEVSTGVITSIKYFFTDTKETLSSKSDFITAYNAATERGECNFTPSSRVTAEISKPDTDYKYVYVMSESGNGYVSNVASYDFTSGTSSSVDQDSQTPDINEGSKDSGLFDYSVGELILLVLVVVLIVSCSLIIVQKIVDYKKKLY